jgi:GntR family transcriptional regulator/MocR family aminotransferase
MIYDFLVLDAASKTPLYIQLYECVKQGILAGNIHPGDKLPSIRKLAAGLELSRTTIENAYQQLCIEGYVENRPQRGYFVAARPQPLKSRLSLSQNKKKEKVNYRYNLGSDCIDSESFDTGLWRRYMKDVLNSPELISSYGSFQGEEELRDALADYAYGVRGVAANPEQIVVGAGMQPLLSTFCGLLRNTCMTVGFEEPGFRQAEQIFRDYRCPIQILATDRDGVTLQALEHSGVEILFLNPSARPMSLTRRYQVLQWAKEHNALILEDDNNGELRYNARPVPALQGIAGSEEVVYIGSFSKLLLPAVRLAYMVLPTSLADSYQEKGRYYNQTASKIEQLALARYIREGRLEKHLRRLRKVYAQKSQLFMSELIQAFGRQLQMELWETSLCLDVYPDIGLSSAQLVQRAAAVGIRLAARGEGVRIGFAGIRTEAIPEVVELLRQVW